jgi:hypothetical protein
VRLASVIAVTMQVSRRPLLTGARFSLLATIYFCLLASLRWRVHDVDICARATISSIRAGGIPSASQDRHQILASMYRNS